MADQQRVVVDPVTRIEGHLRIEVKLNENGVVEDAYSSGTAFRGIELIAEGRDPRDLGLFAQRICGVCTYQHYERSTEAVERAFGVIPPPNARRVRNLLSLSSLLVDHMLHFYQLHSMDWWDVTRVLEADPAKAARLSRRYVDSPYHDESQLARVKQRIAKFVESGQLGPFAKGYWGHPAYKLNPEQNLIMAAHYLENLKAQRWGSQMTAIFGSKMPHPQSLVVGGVTSARDALNAARLAEFGALLAEIKDFVERAYLPDMVMLGEAYKDEALAGHGDSGRNYMSFGFIPLTDAFWEDQEFYLPSGYLLKDDPQNVRPIDPGKIAEEVTHAWYTYTQGDDRPLHPLKGETEPSYTGFDEDGLINPEDKYSWIKTPRYDGHPMEVGPLARFVIAYTAGHERVRALMDGYLRRVGAPFEFFHSTVGRTVARGLESLLVTKQMRGQLDELTEAVARGDERFFTFYTPKDGEGWSLREVARGSLSHWVRIENGRVKHFQAVVPTTWNGSPRDAKGQLSPYEASLIGQPVADPHRPLELIRTVHSYDPCLACAVHLIDPAGTELAAFQVEV